MRNSLGRDIVALLVVVLAACAAGVLLWGIIANITHAP